MTSKTTMEEKHENPEHDAQETTAQAEENPAVDPAAEASEGQEAPGPEDTDWQDKYLRLYAEFDNFRKRTMRERGDLIRNASMNVLEKLLPVLDDFERAAADDSVDVEAVREGRNLIHTKMPTYKYRILRAPDPKSCFGGTNKDRVGEEKQQH